MNQLAHKCQMPWWLTVIIVIETLPMFLGPLFALNNPAFLYRAGGHSYRFCDLALHRAELCRGHGLRRRLPPEKCAYAIYFDTHQVADRPSRWPRLLAVWNGEQRDKTDGDICHWVLHTGDDRLTLSLEANDELYCD